MVQAISFKGDSTPAKTQPQQHAKHSNHYQVNRVITDTTVVQNHHQLHQPHQPQQSEQAQQPHKTRAEYPMSSAQHKFNKVVGAATGSAIMGGIVAWLAPKATAIKALKAKAGIGTGVALFAANLLKGFNGEYDVDYANKKQKFEKTAIKLEKAANS